MEPRRAKGPGYLETYANFLAVVAVFVCTDKLNSQSAFLVSIALSLVDAMFFSVSEREYV